LEGVGRRAKPEIADYVLAYRNHKLAVIEAKAIHKHYTGELAQAKAYTKTWGAVRIVPFADKGGHIRAVTIRTSRNRVLERSLNNESRTLLMYPCFSASRPEIFANLKAELK
jgi:type I restriction enzyme R subunit